MDLIEVYVLTLGVYYESYESSGQAALHATL